jgi:glycosyltransferase involved in cell wall biosynthesis
METADLKSTPTVNKGEISIIFATRGRPKNLVKVFSSLRDNTTRKELVHLWIYVDEDDSVTRQAIESKTLPDPGFQVHWHIASQTNELGKALDTLWRVSPRTSEIYVTTVDDVYFATPGWDEILRSAFNQYPDGVLLAFPHDPENSLAVTYAIFGWRWHTTLGCLYIGYFAYWYDDRWVEEIARLAGRLKKLDMTFAPMDNEKGRTKRMRNLPFWARFMQLTLPERIESAKKLINAMHPQDGPEREAALKNLEHEAARLRTEQDKFSDIYCVFQEERHSDVAPELRRQFSKLHFACETKAVQRLIFIAQDFMEKKEFTEAMKCLDAVNFSDLRVRQVQEMKVECLRQLGRNAEAETILKENLAAWPEMNFIRRLFRFLGAFANDGKRMLVGIFGKNPDSTKPR